DGEQQAREVVEVEWAPAARGGQRGLDPVPGDEDGGEGTKQVLAHSVEEADVVGEQLADGLKDELEVIGLHGGNGSFGVWVRTKRDYGMRKFWSESVSVPVTWAILPARVARRVMSALMVLVVASRCCLAARVCCSSKEARSLLESCAVRSARTPAALILLSTETSL